MATEIVFENVEEVLEVIKKYAFGEDYFGLGDADATVFAKESLDIRFGKAFDLLVRLPEGYHTEIPAQFLDAYHKESQRILRLIALILNGRADIKTLTNEQLEKYRFSVRVTEGSSEFLDNAKDVFSSALKEAFSRMSGRQAIIAILGTVAIISSAWGWDSFVAAKKEVRLAELEQQGRRDIIEGMQESQEVHTTSLEEIVAIMRASGDVGRHAADSSEAVQSDRLRAAAQTNITEIGGVRITQEEARELRSTSRRQSEIVTIEKEMRVVDINTADMANTSLILEDVTSGEQSKVVYADRMLGAVVGDVALDALRNRSTALFTLKERRIEGEVISVEIVSARSIDGTVSDTDGGGPTEPPNGIIAP